MAEKIALRVEEVADYTGIGRNTVRNLIKAKKLPIGFMVAEFSQLLFVYKAFDFSFIFE